MHLVYKLCFLTLEKWLSIDVLCIPAVQAPLEVQAACSGDSPHEGCVVPFVVAGYVGGLIGLVDPGLSGTYLYRGCWLLVTGAWSQGSGQQISRGPGVRPGSLVGGLKTRRLCGCGPPTGGKARSWG